MNLTLTNARLVLRDETFAGTVAVSDGRIADISAGATAARDALDMNGDWLMPGLVELHTDNLEKHLMPRPKVRWPVMPALLAHDAQIAASGITTVLDAIAVGDIDLESVRVETLDAALQALNSAIAHDLLRAEHLLHLRCELAVPNLLELLAPLADDPRVKLVSLMDHTPGQRQWTDLDHYRTYVTGKKGWSHDKVDVMLDTLAAAQRQHADRHRATVVERFRARGVPLATHDDTTVGHVEQARDEGVCISEFPTTVAAAEAARAHGLGIVMGAPNVVRGGSHSGNVAALDLARRGLLDALSSDYVPASLLHAAFLLVDEAGWSLPRAVACVSAGPAAMVGLDDRGEIGVGKRADLIRVRRVDDGHAAPVVVQAWRAGGRIV